MFKDKETDASIEMKSGNDRIPELERHPLESLFLELNRTRYNLDEQEEFIRRFLIVHSALVAFRSGNGKGKNRSNQFVQGPSVGFKSIRY